MEPIEQVSGHHRYLEIQHTLFNAFPNIPLRFKRDTSNPRPLALLLSRHHGPPVAPFLPQEPLDSALYHTHNFRLIPISSPSGVRIIAQGNTDDDNAPRRVQLAGVGVGGGRPDSQCGRGVERLGSVECTGPGELDDAGDVGRAAGFGRRPSGYVCETFCIVLFCFSCLPLSASSGLLSIFPSNTDSLTLLRVLFVALPLRGRGRRYGNLGCGAWGSVKCIPKTMGFSLAFAAGWAEEVWVSRRRMRPFVVSTVTMC